MNKRINILAEQAGLHCDGTPDCWDQEAIARFAQLIVRECSKVIVNGGYINPAFGEKYPLAPPEIAKMIEEHFGVE